MSIKNNLKIKLSEVQNKIFFELNEQQGKLFGSQLVYSIV